MNAAGLLIGTLAALVTMILGSTHPGPPPIVDQIPPVIERLLLPPSATPTESEPSPPVPPLPTEVLPPVPTSQATPTAAPTPEPSPSPQRPPPPGAAPSPSPSPSRHHVAQGPFDPPSMSTPSRRPPEVRGVTVDRQPQGPSFVDEVIAALPEVAAEPSTWWPLLGLGVVVLAVWAVMQRVYSVMGMIESHTVPEPWAHRYGLDDEDQD